MDQRSFGHVTEGSSVVTWPSGESWGGQESTDGRSKEKEKEKREEKREREERRRWELHGTAMFGAPLQPSVGARIHAGFPAQLAPI